MENRLTLSPELLKQAAKVPSAAALQALAQENGITMTAEEAANCYARFHPETGTLSDEELDNVSGGGCNPKCVCGKEPIIEDNVFGRDYYVCECGRKWVR